MTKHDAVQNPAHYDLFPGQQVIDIIRATLTPAEFTGYLKGNVLKYRLRAGEKGDPVEDLGKAAKYRTWLYQYREEGFTRKGGALSGERLEAIMQTAPKPEAIGSATHRDGGGNRYRKDAEGRWLQWGNNEWFTFSDDPSAVPEKLRRLKLSDSLY